MVIALIGETVSKIIIRLTRLQNIICMSELRCLLQAEAPKAFSAFFWGRKFNINYFIDL